MEDVPPQLKSMKRFLRESKKLAKVKPVISYYTRLYAVQQAMNLPAEQRDGSVKSWLGTQMGVLEGMKVTASKEEAAVEVTTMADNIFAHADKVDRAGNADKKTAAAFNSAFVLYEVLKYFGERDDEVAERAKYAIFKTTDILKALREGRKPDPGPPGGDGDQELEEEFRNLGGESGGMNDSTSAMNSASSWPEPQPQAPSQPTNIPQSQPPPQYSPQQPPSNTGYPNPYAQSPPNSGGYGAPPSNSQGYGGYPNPYAQSRPQPQAQPQIQPRTQPQQKVKPQPQTNYGNSANMKQFENKVVACAEAEKLMKHAFAAMKFNDVGTAIDKCKAAIAILEPHRDG